MQALAFSAPAPVVLSCRNWDVLSQAVVSAAGMVVRPSGRADSLGRAAGEVHSLALVAPAPVALDAGQHDAACPPEGELGIDACFAIRYLEEPAKKPPASPPRVLRGGFQNSLARRPATRKRQAAWSRD